MSYLRLRETGRHVVPPAQTIRSIKLYHRQVYGTFLKQKVGYPPAKRHEISWDQKYPHQVLSC